MAQFYDDKYHSREFYWGKQPSSMCHRVLQVLPPVGKRTLLDIGCGEGRNAIFFAQNVYVVTGFDLSAVGIEKAGDWANELKLSIELFQADVNRYRLNEPFDILFSSGTLQYIPEEKRKELISHYKEFTKPGGLNAFTIPVSKPFLPPDPDPDGNEYPWISGELFTHYHDWKIEYCIEEIIEYGSEGFPRKFAVNRIIAAKTS